MGRLLVICLLLLTVGCSGSNQQTDPLSTSGTVLSKTHQEAKTTNDYILPNFDGTGPNLSLPVTTKIKEKWILKVKYCNSKNTCKEVDEKVDQDIFDKIQIGETYSKPNHKK